MNNVNACNALGNRMFHLQSSVHLEEVELALSVNQKLHRSFTNVTSHTLTHDLKCTSNDCKDIDALIATETWENAQ